uniref:tRNA threonylcarbamoyladenosine biosynthesis protein TsaE n=1 Tax=Paulinella longichromatophora TaxID=1708747 RepID=A0A2H4ZPK3_9EUKA|nr:hypothetical protein PLO_446 [Paulinella longichromatophora]
MEHWLISPKATHLLGIELAQPLIAALSLKNDTLPIVLLSGNLGSGKTCLVKGLAKGLNISESITSPTFTLSQWYVGHINRMVIQLMHIDLYRLDQSKLADEFLTEEIQEAINSNTVIVVEWPERLSFVPKNCWRVELKIETEGRRALITSPRLD